jgi:ubiquinone/menaquinone biosynthesis C-methylase UbiE
MEKMKSIVENHFDKVAVDYDLYKKKNKYYYDNLKKLLKTLIPQNKNVFEFGCGTGELLTSLKPTSGVGYDLSPEMIKLAKRKYKFNKKLSFTHRSLFTVHRSLDYVFMTDVIEHLEDPLAEFKKISKLMNKKTIFICTMANPIWEPILMIWEKLGLKMKEGPHKRIRFEDLRIMIQESGMKVIKHDYKLLIPIKVPMITYFANTYLEKYLNKYAFIEYVIASKK